jgi:hypothetical protein
LKKRDATRDALFEVAAHSPMKHVNCPQYSTHAGNNASLIEDNASQNISPPSSTPASPTLQEMRSHASVYLLVFRELSQRDKKLGEKQPDCNTTKSVHIPCEQQQRRTVCT